MQHGPAVRRRKLGEELRALRDRSGLTSGEVARIVGWHQSKVSRIETGRSGVKSADIRLLLDAYGEVVSPQQRALLEALGASAAGPAAHGDAARGRQWWHDYRGLLPQEYRDFISLEAGARAARTVELSVVPGLLQTPEYARAVTRAALGGLPEPKVDALVDVRLARQAVLRSDPPLERPYVFAEFQGARGRDQSLARPDQQGIAHGTTEPGEGAADRGGGGTEPLRRAGHAVLLEQGVQHPQQVEIHIHS
ncbi:hypothetical protein SLAVM298S_00118 [Streptomyces lavendulae subsp. lavendulae]